MMMMMMMMIVVIVMMVVMMMTMDDGIHSSQNVYLYFEVRGLLRDPVFKDSWILFEGSGFKVLEFWAIVGASVKGSSRIPGVDLIQFR